MKVLAESLRERLDSSFQSLISISNEEYGILKIEQEIEYLIEFTEWLFLRSLDICCFGFWDVV